MLLTGVKFSWSRMAPNKCVDRDKSGNLSSALSSDPHHEYRRAYDNTLYQRISVLREL
jgi:hypothetical protein